MSWLPFRIATACVSESLNIPATAGGNWEVGVLGVLGKVPGVEAPVMVRGSAFSMVEMYEASDSRSRVTECSQSDLPVEMTTWLSLSDKQLRDHDPIEDDLTAVGLHGAQHVRSCVNHGSYFFWILLVACGE